MGLFLSNICSLFQRATGIITLEGVQCPRQGQPPEEGKKEAARHMSRGSFCSRRRSIGRRLRAPEIIRRCTARPPLLGSVPGGQARPVLLRLLDTPAQVIRLTADSHMPAEPLLCMGAATPHRWSPSARLLPEPETLTAGGPREPPPLDMYFGQQKNHPSGVVAAPHRRPPPRPGGR